MKAVEVSEGQRILDRAEFCFLLCNCFIQLLLCLHLSDFSVNSEKRVGDSSKIMSLLSVIIAKLEVNFLDKLNGSPLFFITLSDSLTLLPSSHTDPPTILFMPLPQMPCPTLLHILTSLTSSDPSPWSKYHLTLEAFSDSSYVRVIRLSNKDIGNS